MSQEPSVAEDFSVVGGSFIFDRPEVAKLRDHRGRDPRQQSEVVKENI